MISLRKAEFNDHAAIAALHTESWRKHYRGILSDNFLDHKVADDHSKVWSDRFKNPAANQRIILATDEDRLVGFAGLFLDDDPEFGSLLDNLHVVFMYHQKGIGRMLMNECARIVLKEALIRSMYLWVYEENTRARIFYERMGGLKYETIEKENEDATFARICRYFWKDLDSSAR